MNVKQMNWLGKSSLTGLLGLALVACAGPGVPTPPGTIGSEPQSIMETQPPVTDPNAPPDQTANLDQSQVAPNDLPPASSVPATTELQQQTNTYTPPVSAAVLTFEPMVGAPKRVARELSTTLGARVAQQALPVVARSDKKVTHRVKGYFSASQSGSDCVVSYVWDIFDANGKRINRVTGSQKTPMVSADPWDSVKGKILDDVAVDTAGKLKSWHASI